MDILIPNLELPNGDEVINLSIDQYGNVLKHERIGYKKYQAVELPPHGRLIDSDELQEVLRIALSLLITNELTEKEISLVHRTIGAISDCVNVLDTVLEASNGSID